MYRLAELTGSASLVEQQAVEFQQTGVRRVGDGDDAGLAGRDDGRRGARTGPHCSQNSQRPVQVGGQDRGHQPGADQAGDGPVRRGGGGPLERVGRQRSTGLIALNEPEVVREGARRLHVLAHAAQVSILQEFCGVFPGCVAVHPVTGEIYLGDGVDGQPARHRRYRHPVPARLRLILSGTATVHWSAAELPAARPDRW